MTFRNIMLFGLLMALAPFAHMVRYSESPVIATAVEWFMYCTAFIYFAASYITRWHLYRNSNKFTDNDAFEAVIVMFLYTIPLKHAFMLVDYPVFESGVALMALAFFVYCIKRNFP